MAYTQAMLDKLDEAIATGALRITHNGKTVEYRSMNDMVRARNMIEKKLAEAAGAVRSSSGQMLAPTYDRGYR